MGYEINYKYHPRLEEGVGYNHEVEEVRKVKVGKPFDDTPLEKCAAAITAQLARRDIWVIDVDVYELVKKQISFKESKDGKGIVLKNKRFTLGATAELIAEDLIEVPMVAPVVASTALVPAAAAPVQSNLEPHEMITAPTTQGTDNLYSNPNQAAVRRSIDPRNIDKTKALYQVYYEPYVSQAEAKSLKLRFTEDTRYNVHQVIPSATGKLDAQQIALTDDTGQVVVLDEKFFTSAGRGLVGDAEVGFSEPRSARRNKNKLMYDGELTTGGQELASSGAAVGDIPVDDGHIPEDLLVTPDLRPGRAVR
jgi:hypothetical protein